MNNYSECEVTVGVDLAPSRRMVTMKIRDEGGREFEGYALAPDAAETLAQYVRDAAARVRGGEAESSSPSVSGAQAGFGVSVYVDAQRGRGRVLLHLIDTDVNHRMNVYGLTVERADEMAAALAREAASARRR